MRLPSGSTSVDKLLKTLEQEQMPSRFASCLCDGPDNSFVMAYCKSSLMMTGGAAGRCFNGRLRVVMCLDRAMERDLELEEKQHAWLL